MLKEELIFPGNDFEFFFPYKPMISCDASNHARHRKAVGPAFSERALRSYEPLLITYAEMMLDKLEQHQEQQEHNKHHDGTCKGGQGLNITDWFHFLMFDITSALVFGKPFGNMAAGRYHAWVARVFPGMKLIAWSMVVASVPGLGRLVSWCIPRVVVEEARRHVQGIVDMMDARASPSTSSINGGEVGEKQPDFMTSILSHPSQTEPTYASKTLSSPHLSTPELYLNSQLLCIAGSETTASLLAGTVYFLSLPQNKHHLSRLVSELRTQFPRESDVTPSRLSQTCTSSSSSSSARPGTATGTPFLSAVLSEVLRLYPPGAINMPRTVPPGGALIDGQYVPGGSVVGIAQYAAYRSKTHWVEPITFAPERWLHGSEASKRYEGDRREVFKPFSHGPRNCIGQSLAMAECRLVIARLYWRYEVHVLPGQEGWVRQKTFLSWEKPALTVRVERRRWEAEAEGSGLEIRG